MQIHLYTFVQRVLKQRDTYLFNWTAFYQKQIVTSMAELTVATR